MLCKELNNNRVYNLQSFSSRNLSYSCKTCPQLCHTRQNMGIMALTETGRYARKDHSNNVEYCIYILLTDTLIQNQGQLMNKLIAFCLHWFGQYCKWPLIKRLVPIYMQRTHDECCGKIDLFRVQNRVVHILPWWECCQVYKTEG